MGLLLAQIKNQIVCKLEIWISGNAFVTTL